MNASSKFASLLLLAWIGCLDRFPVTRAAQKPSLSSGLRLARHGAERRYLRKLNFLVIHQEPGHSRGDPHLADGSRKRATVRHRRIYLLTDQRCGLSERLRLAKDVKLLPD